jgi:hypothetical protein
MDNLPFHLRLKLAIKMNELYKTKCETTSKDFDKTYDCIGLADMETQLVKSLQKDLKFDDQKN